MVNDIRMEYGYTVATEPEVNELLVGKDAGTSVTWPSYSRPPQVPTGRIGVFWKRGNSLDDPVQPLALVAGEEDVRRLCGRFAQLRSDLSPLSAWCHLLQPESFYSLESNRREPNLGGLEAAWTGLIIAEAQLLFEMPLSELHISNCIGTQSFAVARARALWKDISKADIGRRFDEASRIIKSPMAAHPAEAHKSRIRAALEPILTCLWEASSGRYPRIEDDLAPILMSLEELREARRLKDKDEASRFAGPLFSEVPEAGEFFGLREVAPEQRLKIFDHLVNSLAPSVYQSPLRRNALALLAGYLSTVAAGGTPTLSLAENNARRLPEITGWAYVVGGIGEKVLWTSSFEGLGRFVARELTRPLSLEEPPTCDFALDEASVLIDPKLVDPLVHLRLKYGRIATIALLPGVNIPISYNALNQEQQRRPTQTFPQADSMRPNRNPVALIADAIWPYLRAHVEELLNSRNETDVDSQNYSSANSRRRSPSQLPLKGSKK